MDRLNPSRGAERDDSLPRHSRRRSSKHSKSIDNLTNVLTRFIDQTSKRSSSSFAGKGEVVPAFNPEAREQSAETWCCKIDELREVFKWTEEATIYFALTKLQGLAEVWYKGLPTLKLTWAEWKAKLVAAFPCKRDFFGELKRMTRRNKRPDESYSNYFYEKMVLLTNCKIAGSDAVSCLIGGIDDNIVKIGAKAGNHQSPESLFQYLSTLNEMPQSSGSVHPHSMTKGFPKPKPQYKVSRQFHPHIAKPTESSPQRFETKTDNCFRCGLPGHQARACKKAAGQYCTYCNKSGHTVDICFRKKASGTVA